MIKGFFEQITMNSQIFDLNVTGVRPEGGWRGAAAVEAAPQTPGWLCRKNLGECQ